MSATDLAIAECDAQRVGSDREPGTAVQDVAPKVRRFVTLRDRKHCTVPGCRAARHIDVHHIVPRHLGGGHEAENLTLLCSGHHRALHDGRLTITGHAPALVVEWPNGVVATEAADLEPALPHVGHVEARHGEPSNYDWTVKKTQAAQALKQLDIALPAARAFVEEAARKLPRTATLEQLFRGALQLFRQSQPAFVTRSK